MQLGLNTRVTMGTSIFIILEVLRNKILTKMGVGIIHQMRACQVFHCTTKHVKLINSPLPYKWVSGQCLKKEPLTIKKSFSNQKLQSNSSCGMYKIKIRDSSSSNKTCNGERLLCNYRITEKTKLQHNVFLRTFTEQQMQASDCRMVSLYTECQCHSVGKISVSVILLFHTVYQMQTSSVC